jgi:signal transduction histidine kinase
MTAELTGRFRRLDALPDATAYVDSQGGILAGNGAFQDLCACCGFGGDQFEGHTLLDIFEEDEQASLRRTLSAPAPARRWSRSATLAGSLSSTCLEFVPISRRTHAGTLWLVTLRSPQDSSDESEDEASRAALTAGVVHDLRAPLQSVLGWASVLRRTGEPELIERAATIIERNARLQVALLEDLLEVLHPTGTRSPVHRQTIDLAELVAAELRAVEPLARERGLRVSVTVDSPAIAVEGNETHLRRVIGNLLGDALKFTSSGGSIECRVWQSAGGAGIIVRNTGREIERPSVPGVVAEGPETPHQDSRSEDDRGLGLSIVRHLLKLHGGTVTAASAGPGSGATYSVFLPAAPCMVETGKQPVVSVW